MILIDKLFQIDAYRSKAIADAQSYEAISARRAQFGLLGQVRSAADKMPLITPQVAKKIADKHIEIARSATLSSIYAKINAIDKPLTLEESIKLAKSQKKDSMYDSSMRAIFTCRGIFLFLFFVVVRSNTVPHVTLGILRPGRHTNKLPIAELIQFPSMIQITTLHCNVARSSVAMFLPCYYSFSLN